MTEEPQIKKPFNALERFTGQIAEIINCDCGTILNKTLIRKYSGGMFGYERYVITATKSGTPFHVRDAKTRLKDLNAALNYLDIESKKLMIDRQYSETA